MKMTLDKKLGKLKMPAKNAGPDLSDLSEGSEADEGSPEEEASESPDEEAAEGDDSSSPDALKAVSDDELLAEIKKRGLVSQLEKSGADDTGDDQSNYA